MRYTVNQGFWSKLSRYESAIYDFWSTWYIFLYSHSSTKKVGILDNIYIYAIDFSKIIKSNLMLTELSESNVNFDSYYEHTASTVIGMQLAGIICFAVK